MEKQDFKRWLRVRTDTPEPINELLGTAALLGGAAYAASKHPWVRKKFGDLKRVFTEPDVKPETPPAPNPRSLTGYSSLDIGEHPYVDKYYKHILSELLLDGSHKIVSVQSGEQVEIPEQFKKALKSYIASHVLEDSTSRLRLSYPKAVQIIKFLDSVKVEGDDESLAEKADATSPRGLTVFIQNNVDTSPTFTQQYGYDKGMPMKKVSGDVERSEPPAPVAPPWESHEDVKELKRVVDGLLGTNDHPGALRKLMTGKSVGIGAKELIRSLIAITDKLQSTSSTGAEGTKPMT
jgi:hypothetical protein